MKNYNQQELEEMIICPKAITKPPRKEMKLEKRHFRNDFELESVGDGIKFSAFMRKNEDFPENFSIGVRVHPNDESESFCLLRCNGPHGDHVNNLLDHDPHFGFHIHTAKADNIEKDASSELYAELTERYGSYEEALIYFLERINIENVKSHFDMQPKHPLFPEIGGDNAIS